MGKQDQQQRITIAMEAARQMAESGISDFQLAKRKAAQKLGLNETRNLPSNQEIEQALISYQQLFQSESQPHVLRELRETALEAMRFLKGFNPRLAGDVLSGTASQHSSVELHLFCEYPEQINMFLMDHHIPFNEKQKRFRWQGDDYEMRPVYHFFADEHEVELVAFSSDNIRRAPLSPVNGRPMERVDMQQLEELLSADLTSV